jgi:predicted nucleic acid-binding protein
MTAPTVIALAGGCPAIWELRENVTVYDAAYLTLAEALGAPMLTADTRVAHAPRVSCDVELLG